MATVVTRYLICSLRVAVAVALATVVVDFIVGEQLGGFYPSLSFVLTVVLRNTDFHVGKTLRKATNNVLATIVGGVLGFGLRWCSDNFIEKDKSGFILPVIFALIMLAIYLQCKEWEDKYGISIITFLLVIAGVLLSPESPKWLSDKFFEKAGAFGISFALIVLSTFCPSYWAGADMHDRIREYVDSLADIFKVLKEKGFAACGDSDFSEQLQVLIVSKEKEISLIKSMSWEWPWRHLRKQFEVIGDRCRTCATNMKMLSIYCNENHLTPDQLQESCSKIYNELASALEQLSLSMEHKIPVDSVEKHLADASDLIKGLLGAVPCKQSGQERALPELQTKQSSLSDEPGTTRPPKEEGMSGHVAIDIE